jgi:hypothetical protein
VSKDSDQTETAPRKFKLGPLGSLNQVTKGLAKTIRAMADGTLDSQVGARICNGLGIMRACLETQKLEQLEARMDEIADRFPIRRRDGHLFHLRCNRPVPGLRRSPFFGSGDARAGDKRDLSQVRPCVHRNDRSKNRARVGRREEAQRPSRGSRTPADIPIEHPLDSN